MANPTINEKIQARYNAKRVESSMSVIDFSGYNMGPAVPYSGPQSVSNTRIYAVPLPSSNNLGRLKIFLNRPNLSEAVNILVAKGQATRVNHLLPQIGDELGLELVEGDMVDDVLPAGLSFVCTASINNRIFIGSTVIKYE